MQTNYAKRFPAEQLKFHRGKKRNLIPKFYYKNLHYIVNTGIKKKIKMLICEENTFDSKTQFFYNTY